MPEPRREDHRWETGVALLLYMPVAMLLFWPVSGSPVSDFVTSHVDPFGHIWRAWRLEQSGPWSLAWMRDTNLLQYPYGSNIPGGGVLASLHAAPCVFVLYALTRFLPVALAWNLSLIGAAALTGTSAFLLVREVTGGRSAAWLAGLLLVLSTGYVEEAYEGILEQTALFPLILYLLFSVRWLRHRRRSDALAAAGLFLAAALTSFYQGLFAGAATLAVYLVVDPSRTRRGAVVLALLGAALYLGRVDGPSAAWVRASAIILSPPSAASVLQQGDGGGERASFPGGGDDLDPARARDLAWWNLFGSVAPRTVLSRSHPRPLKTHTLQPIHFFALLGLVLAFRSSLPWALAGLGFALWSLGPYAILPGDRLGPPGPAWLLYAIAPALMKVRPCRLWMAAQICAMVVAGLGLRVLLARMSESIRRFAIFGVVAVALVDILYIPPRLLPCGTLSGKVPAFYRHVRQDPDTRAILEWPYFTSSSALWGKALYCQTQHGKSLVNSGSGSLRYQLIQQRLTDNCLLDGLVQEGSEEERPVRRKDVEALRLLGVRYIVVHDRVPAASMRFFGIDQAALFSVRLLDGLEAFLGPPAARGEGVLAYETTPTAALWSRPLEPPDRRAYRADIFPNAWLRFTPSMTPQRAVLPPLAQPPEANRISFWFRCREGPDRLEALVQEGRGSTAEILARAEIAPEPSTWQRVDLPFHRPYRGRGELTLSLVRPQGLAVRTVEIFQVEVTRP